MTRLTRRQFSMTAAAAGAAALAPGIAGARPRVLPWMARVKRWGQVNLTSEDAVDFDIPFWRSYWKATRTQGAVISAGGQYAFYPTALPDQPRVPGLGDRDLLGELVKVARDEGMVVLARMALRGSADLLAKHPDWACVDANGKRTATACMNGGYTYQYGADIVREVGRRYRPDGFTLSGWGVNYGLCYCERCTSLFRKSSGEALPRKRDWDDPLFRRWVSWNDDQVIALWDYSNKVARDAAGPDCLWIGQLLGSMLTRNLKRISDRAPLMMIDHQAAEDEAGPVDNHVFGKVINGLRGWARPATVATALYGPRLNSPSKEAIGLWMQEGFAGGARPWWNIIGGYTEDKRRFTTLPPLLQWHESNEAYLFDRRPVASIGIVWSETNNVFYGRDDFARRVHAPFQGMVNALTRARIPFVVVHADDLERDAADLAGIILPDLAAMTDAQIAAVRRLAAKGVGVLATGETSLRDAGGVLRADYALADLFGVHRAGDPPLPMKSGLTGDQAAMAQGALMQSVGNYVPASLIASSVEPQSFLRLTPSLSRNAYGPHRAYEPTPAPGAVRHAALRGFDGTELIHFGGLLQPLKVEPDAQVLLTFVPVVPNGSPEDVVFKVRETNVPGLVVRERPGAGRTAFLVADLDRRYDRANTPDHGDLLANLVRWIARERMPVEVDAQGLFDISLYRQPTRMIVHITNLNNSGVWKAPVDAYAPSGAIDLRIRLASDVRGAEARLLVAEGSVPVVVRDGWAELRLPSILAHEVIVIS